MSQTAVQRQPDYLGLVAAGYVMAFVLPIGGIIVGLLLSEKRTGHAVVLCFLSTLIGIGYALLVLSVV